MMYAIIVITEIKSMQLLAAVKKMGTKLWVINKIILSSNLIITLFSCSVFKCWSPLPSCNIKIYT